MKIYLFILISSLLVGCASKNSWQTASKESMGIAPLAQDEPEAIVQLYVARTYNWRKYFAVHSWISIKEKNASQYTNYHVTAWGARRDGDSVWINQDLPDRRWFGADADMIVSLKGEKAEAAILKIKKAVENYPYRNTYRIFPGPNSNTFISYILRQTPEIGVELPPTAIGKDWINEGDFFGVSETNTGFQVSALGVLGFTLGLGEGVEVNLLGMSFGLDLWRPAIKLPFVGRLGFADAPVF